LNTKGERGNTWTTPTFLQWSFHFKLFVLNRIPRCETKLLFLHVWPAEFKKPVMSWQVMIWVKDLVNHCFHLFKRKLWRTTGSFGKKRPVVSLGINRLVSMQVIQKKREQQLDDWKVRCVGWLTPQDAEIVFRHVEITVAKHEALGKWWEKGWSIKQSWLAFPCVSDSILYSILFAVLDRRWIIIARVVNILWKYIRIPRFCWKLLICQRLWTHILLPTIFVHRFIPLHSDCFNEAWGIKNRYIHPPKKLTWPWRNYDGCWNHFPDSVWSPAYTRKINMEHNHGGLEDHFLF